MTTATKPPENIDVLLEDLIPSETNARKDFNATELKTLVISIKAQGILQPIMIRNHPTESGKYEIIGGERRYRAALKSKINAVPCRLFYADDIAALEMQVAENLARVELNVMEQATAWQSLIDLTGKTQKTLAEKYNTSQGRISNLLRLLNLPKVWQNKIIAGEAPPTFGRDLAAFIELPQVFKELERAIDRMARGFDPGYKWELFDYRMALADSIMEVSADYAAAAPLSLTPALERELNLVSISESILPASRRRIFNTKRLAALLKEVEAQEETTPQEMDIASPHQLDAAPLFDPEEMGPDPAQDESIPEKSPEEIQANIDHAQEVADRNKANAAKQWPQVDYREYKLAWIRGQVTRRLDDDDFIMGLSEYAIPMDSEWRLDEVFLTLHTDGQLMELARLWGFDMARLEGYQGQNLIDELLIMDRQLWIAFADETAPPPAEIPTPLLNAGWPV